MNSESIPHVTKLQGREILLWTVLFLVFATICFSQGYQTLNRYDPRTSWHDTRSYYAMVNWDFSHTMAPFHHRVLTPLAAGLVRKIIPASRIATWDPVFLSLLLVNMVFMSWACLLIVRCGELVTGKRTIGLLAALLFVTGWVNANETMCGGVDAAVCLVTVAVILALLREAWWRLPWLVAVGALAKETAMLFSLVFIFVWIVYLGVKKGHWRRGAILSGIVAAVAGFCIFRGLWIVIPKEVYEAHLPSWTLLAAIPHNARSFLHHEVLEGWGLFLAIGLFRLRRLPGELTAATAAVAVVALLSGAYAGIEQNVGRLLYNSVGPVVAISCAIFLYELLEPKCLPAQPT